MQAMELLMLIASFIRLISASNEISHLLLTVNQRQASYLFMGWNSFLFISICFRYLIGCESHIFIDGGIHLNFAKFLAGSSFQVVVFDRKSNFSEILSKKEPSRCSAYFFLRKGVNAEVIQKGTWRVPFYYRERPWDVWSDRKNSHFWTLSAIIYSFALKVLVIKLYCLIK